MSDEMPEYKLIEFTDIFGDTEQPRIRVRGLVPLSVGDVIELGDPNRNATITHRRLQVWNGQAVLCLDVKTETVEEAIKRRKQN